MDHLIYEISQLLHEAEDPAVVKTHSERTSRVRRLALLQQNVLCTFRVWKTVLVGIPLSAEDGVQVWQCGTVRVEA